MRKATIVTGVLFGPSGDTFICELQGRGKRRTFRRELPRGEYVNMSASERTALVQEGYDAVQRSGRVNE